MLSTTGTNDSSRPPTAVASIVEGAELISTDDEHDPEGATIAYERAQAIALLRQATITEALSDLSATLRAGAWPVCSICGDEIGRERMEAHAHSPNVHSLRHAGQPGATSVSSTIRARRAGGSIILGSCR